MSKLKPATLVSSFIKSGVHGEYGDGKTLLGSTYPGPRIWLDPAYGCRYYAEETDFITNTRDIDSFVDAVDDAARRAHSHDIQTIIFDDVSVMQRNLTGVLAGDPDEVHMDEWGEIKGIVNRMMDKVIAAPAHLLITSRASMVAAETTTVDGKEKIKNVHKAARPKAWDEWIYPVDYQMFMFSRGSELAPDKIKYFAQFQKSRGGRRYASLKQGAIVEDPTFERLFAELLKAESGMPMAEYEDNEAIVAAARSTRTVNNEAEFDLAAKQIKMADSPDVLAGAWTKVANLIQASKLSVAQQKELLKLKNETKVRLGMPTA